MSAQAAELRKLRRQVLEGATALRRAELVRKAGESGVEQLRQELAAERWDTILASGSLFPSLPLSHGEYGQAESAGATAARESACECGACALH